VNVGVPYLSDLPIIGVPFRRTTDDVEEIELLVLVTPEFVDAMEPHQVPCGGPGVFTTSPTNRDLYCGGYVEVPLHCNPTHGMSACGEQVYGYGCSNCGNRGCSQCGQGGQYGGNGPLITDGVTMPGGVGYDNAYGPPMDAPLPTGDPSQLQTAPMDSTGQPAASAPDDLQLPTSGEPAEATQPSDGTATPGEANYLTPPPTYTSQSQGAAGLPLYTAPRPYSPPRQPVFMRNASRPFNPQPGVGGAASGPVQGNLIGPVGYDPQ
jgi:pilus assembly protein CpaC